ncbi:MAG: hypothetical protein U9N82_12660 [Thermodesulfobacteriota bacterium]|nr:hypothetical protein [Thermodesulfobacteriota bacterium]
MFTYLLRNVDEITSTTMHPGFRASLSGPQSQNPRNSLAITVVLSFRIEQIHPKSERLLTEVVSSTFLTGWELSIDEHQRMIWGWSA